MFLNGALVDTPITAADLAALYQLIRAVEARLGGEVTSEGFDAAADIAPLIDAGNIDGARDALRDRFGARADDPNFVIGFFSGIGPGRFQRLVGGLGGTPELRELLGGFALFTREATSASSFARGASIGQLDTILNTNPILDFGEAFLIAAGNRALEPGVGWEPASMHGARVDPLVGSISIDPALDRVLGAVARVPAAALGVLDSATVVSGRASMSNAQLVLRIGNQAFDQAVPFEEGEPDGIADLLRAGTASDFAASDEHREAHLRVLHQIGEAIEQDAVRLQSDPAGLSERIPGATRSRESLATPSTPRLSTSPASGRGPSRSVARASRRSWPTSSATSSSPTSTSWPRRQSTSAAARRARRVDWGGPIRAGADSSTRATYRASWRASSNTATINLHSSSASSGASRSR
ncbi:MAG: hypothetical protein ACRD29_14600 [Acidimicrobiales bacterium]